MLQLYSTCMANNMCICRDRLICVNLQCINYMLRRSISLITANRSCHVIVVSLIYDKISNILRCVICDASDILPPVIVELIQHPTTAVRDTCLTVLICFHLSPGVSENTRNLLLSFF